MIEAEPRNSKNCQQIPKARGGKEGFSPTGLRCLPTPWFQTSTPQNCEEITFSYLRHMFGCTLLHGSNEFSSVVQSCPTLWDPMGCSMPGLPVHHQLLEFTQTHVHWVNDAIQPSHPLPSPSPPALNLSQHQGLFQRVGFLPQVTKVLELQLQHQSFQWIFRTDFL